MKRTRLHSLCLGVMAVMVGCSDSPASDSRLIELTSAEQSVMESYNALAASYFSEISAMLPGQNSIFSPLSYIVDLSMLKEGAMDETYAALNQHLGLLELNQQDVQSLNHKLLVDLSCIDGKVNLCMANAMWSIEKENIKPGYVDALRTNYNADVKATTPASFVNDVNSWCKQATKGKIANFYQNEDASYCNAILNSLYFKGQWTRGYKFEASNTQTGDFSNADGTVGTADFMFQKNAYPYLRGNSYQAIAMPFGAGSFAFVALLPNDGTGIDECLNDVGNAWLSVPAARKEIVAVTMPKFSIGSRFRFNELLSRLLEEPIFSEDANFSGISDNFVLNEIVQVATFVVDENGAELATVTGSDAPTSPSAIPFKLDRPFAFAIVENSTGCILLLGKVEKL